MSVSQFHANSKPSLSKAGELIRIAIILGVAALPPYLYGFSGSALHAAEPGAREAVTPLPISAAGQRALEALGLNHVRPVKVETTALVLDAATFGDGDDGIAENH